MRRGNMMSKNLYNLALMFHVYCLCSTGCLKSSFQFYIVFCAKHLMLLWANVHWFRQEVYLNNLSKEFQTKILRNYNIFDVLPQICTYASFFPPYFSCPFCRFFKFVFFAQPFLLFSLLLHENEGPHCLCYRVLELKHLFLRFLAIQSKKLVNCWRSLNDLSEQVVKSKDLRR